MKTSFARSWWSLVIRGVVGILMGILTFLWPGITIAAIVIVFGAYALIDGVVNLAGVFKAREKDEPWWALLIEGLVGIIAGLTALFWPAITALALVFVIAAWALVTGIFEIVAAVRLRRYIEGEWILALSGVASVLFGLLLATFPIAGAVALAFWFGAYSIVFGGLLISLGIRLRNRFKGLDFRTPMHAPSH
jgi:uncharacterized membrane protein HdeD (DUF308 family)